MGGEESKPAPPTPPPSPCLRQPWRTLPTRTEDNLNFMKSYQPRNQGARHLRILLHGPVGAGKSNFINPVESALRGVVTGRAETDATSGSSFTLKFCTDSPLTKDDPGYKSNPSLDDKVHVLLYVVPVEKFSKTVGIPIKSIFLVKN
ncbi:interferon-induced protein 44-like [Labrus mixtus]|uniref:interferon-induced protein 44-like n=1 Tax=Labrus mixtus TaxID=508554 RepID=UPI0029C0DB21|nr:interferon-induced protein 44-like [Labrus mixtus]